MKEEKLQVHKACTQRDYRSIVELSKANETKKSPTEEDELNNNSSRTSPMITNMSIGVAFSPTYPKKV